MNSSKEEFLKEGEPALAQPRQDGSALAEGPAQGATADNSASESDAAAQAQRDSNNAPQPDSLAAALNDQEKAPAHAEAAASARAALERAAPVRGPQNRPRRLFPALAATAIAGAGLGAGAAIAALHFAGPQITGISPHERSGESETAALVSRIDSLEAKQESASASLRAGFESLEKRMTSAESAVANAAEAATSAKDEAGKAASEAQKLSAAAGQESAAGHAQGADTGPLETRLAALEQKLASLEPALTAPKGATRAQPERESAAVQHASRAQAIAVVAQSLMRRLDSGTEFSSELTSLEALGVPHAALAQLRAAPQATVASHHQLAADFGSLAPKIAAGGSSGQENADFFSTLSRHAKSLVRIHRLGGEGDGVQALIDRIESALKEHDLDKALSLWQELPPEARAASQSWADAAQIRSAALKAARQIEADAVAALGKPKT